MYNMRIQNETKSKHARHTLSVFNSHYRMRKKLLHPRTLPVRYIIHNTLGVYCIPQPSLHRVLRGGI